VKPWEEPEIFCLKQLMKKGYQTRTIAQTLGRDVLEVHQYINGLLRRDPSAAPPRRQPRTIPHYNDPRSAEVGSRMLLSALVKDFEKRKSRFP